MSSWFLERRKEFIVDRVRRHGIVHKENIADHFGISLQQAALDLRSLRSEYPGFLIRSGKTSGGVTAGPLFEDYIAKGVLEPQLDYSKRSDEQPTDLRLEDSENSAQYWKTRALRAEEFLAVRTEESRRLHPALYQLMRAMEHPALDYWRTRR